MKKYNILIITSLILITFNLKLSAQEDSVIIENSTESTKVSDFKQKKKYNYLDNNFREEKTLIKLQIYPKDYRFPGFVVDRIRDYFNVSLSLEKKIFPSFSVILNNKYGEDQFSKIFSSDLGIRYYYSMNKRMKNSSGANNFHGNYFSYVFENIIEYKFGENDYFFNQPSFNFSWGIQRRIGKIGVVDVGPYISLKRTSYWRYINRLEFGANMLLGLGWGFKK